MMALSHLLSWQGTCCSQRTPGLLLVLLLPCPRVDLMDRVVTSVVSSSSRGTRCCSSSSARSSRNRRLGSPTRDACSMPKCSVMHVMQSQTGVCSRARDIPGRGINVSAVTTPNCRHALTYPADRADLLLLQPPALEHADWFAFVRLPTALRGRSTDLFTHVVWKTCPHFKAHHPESSASPSPTHMQHDARP
jgi:hypothetical protein